jgi:tetratricopeptide (TPR) repeat protein
MIKQSKDDHITRRRSHSKTFKEGLGILIGEIELAFQWNRPSILLAVHNSRTGRVDAQQSLEREIVKRNKKVSYVNVESANPDVIRVIGESQNIDGTVFFISGIENADRASDGRVYQALNMRREVLVEKCICAVFWLNESEAAKLPGNAPDFWAFRHRVVEFAPKRGTKNQSMPTGLFLWQEQIPWMADDVQKDKLAYYEKSLSQLPKEDGSIAAEIEMVLTLAYYSWLLDDPKRFLNYLREGFELLEKYPISQYQAWALNAKAIDLYEKGKKQEASVYFIQALDRDPSNSAIMMNKGIAAYGLGKNREAILTGKRAIKKATGNLHLWRVLGYLFLSMGKIEDAIDTVRTAQGMDPDNLDTCYALAVCYFKNDQFAECGNELAKAHKISKPQNVLQQACVDILNGKTDEAFSQINNALKKGWITKHHVLRDPNLPFLVNLHEWMPE